MGLGFRGELAPAFCIAPGLAWPLERYIADDRKSLLGGYLYKVPSNPVALFYHVLSAPSTLLQLQFQANGTYCMPRTTLFSPKSLIKCWSGRVVVTELSGGPIFTQEKGQLRSPYLLSWSKHSTSTALARCSSKVQPVQPAGRVKLPQHI